MNPGFLFKVICDLSLWFGGAGFVLCQFGASFSLPPLFFMALACGLSRPLRDRGSLRLVPLTLLPLTAFWIHGIPDALLILPPALYCGYLCVRGRFDPDLLTCRSYFRHGTQGLALASAFFALVSGGAVTRCLLPCLLLFLIAGVLMLRALRRGNEIRRPQELALDFLLLGLCCAAAWGLSSLAALHLMGQGISLAYKYLICPLLIGLIYIFAGLAWVLIQFFSLLFSGQIGQENQKTQSDLSSFTDLTPFGVSAGDGRGFWTVMAVIGAAALLFFAYRFFRRLGESGPLRDRATPVETRLFALTSQAAPPASILGSGPRSVVRRCYRRFLIRAREAGVLMTPDSTSESIVRLATDRFDPAALAELRSLYIAARYSPAPVSRESARRAREILSRLKPMNHPE